MDKVKVNHPVVIRISQRRLSEDVNMINFYCEKAGCRDFKTPKFILDTI